MQYLATFHLAKEKLYLTKQNLMKNKKDIYTMCNLDSRKLKAHIQKLMDKGLLKEEDIDGYPSYTFPYDYDGGYQLINYEMLWYLVSTRNKSAIQVYVYLLNKYLWKKQRYILRTSAVVRARIIYRNCRSYARKLALNGLILKGNSLYLLLRTSGS